MHSRTLTAAISLGLAACLVHAVACRSDSRVLPAAGAQGQGGAQSTAAEPSVGRGGAGDQDEVRSGTASGRGERTDAGPPAVSAAQLRAITEAERVEHWYGVYMMGRKVGHARVWLGGGAGDDPGRFTTGTRIRMSVKGPTGTVEMVMTEERFYAEERPYRLVESRFVQETPQGIDHRRVVARGDALMLERLDDAGEVTRRRELPAATETLADLLATMPTDLDRLEVGRPVTAHTFDWQAEEETPVRVEVESIETVRRAGVDTRVATLVVRYEDMGLTARSRVADGGVVLETTLGPGLSLRLEEREVARAGVEGLDVLRSGAPVDERLGDASRVRRLVLDVRMSGQDGPPADDRQRVEALGDGRWRVSLARGPGDAVTEAERREALAPDSTIDADDETIVAKARALTKGVDRDEDKIQRLSSWVHGALRKRLATHIPAASDVLRLKVGDCTEHSWLFVALARAAGLPARPVYGVMYLDTPEPRFGYHAWAEVALDGRWVAVDPTWDQRPVDATHLKLGHGMAGVAGVMGNLALEVVEWDADADPDADADEE